MLKLRGNHVKQLDQVCNWRFIESFCFRGERIQFVVVAQGFLMAAASSGWSPAAKLLNAEKSTSKVQAECRATLLQCWMSCSPECLHITGVRKQSAKTLSLCLFEKVCLMTGQTWVPHRGSIFH